jgi:hypothetical protein
VNVSNGVESGHPREVMDVHPCPETTAIRTLSHAHLEQNTTSDTEERQVSSAPVWIRLPWAKTAWLLGVKWGLAAKVKDAWLLGVT